MYFVDGSVYILMFALTVLKIGVLGLLTEIFQKNRMVRSWSWFLFMAVVLCLWPWLTEQANLLKKSLWFFNWIDTSVIKVDIALRTGTEYAPFIWAQIIALMFALNYNAFFSFEKMRLRYAGLYTLIFVAMMFVVSAFNIMQLLIAICFVDILGFYLLQDIGVKRHYMFFNFFADFLLMVLFALVWGWEHNLNISALKLFVKHSPFAGYAAVLFVISVCIKCGTAFFHNYLLDMKSISFVRGVFMVYATTPFSGLVLLYRCSHAFSAFIWVEYVFWGMLVLSAVWALVSFVLIDAFKAKILYLHMLVVSFLALMIFIDKSEFLRILPFMVLVACMLSGVMILPLVAAANEPLVSKTGGMVKLMKFSLGVSVLSVSGSVYFICSQISQSNVWLLVAFAAVLFLLFIHFFSQVYFGAVHADERVLAVVKNPNILYFMFIFAAWVVLLFYVKPIFVSSYLNFIIFPLMVLLLIILSGWVRPLRFCDNVYAYENLQKSAPALKLFYVCLVFPIKTLGRVLWLTIDFLLIERFLVAFIRQLIYSLIKLSRFAHHNIKYGGVVFMLLGLLIVLFAFFRQKGGF